MRFILQTEPLDPSALLAGFCAGRTDIGAIVSFTGIARDGAGVTLLDLETYPALAVRAIEGHMAEARARFELIDLFAAHRYGQILPGETIVFVAAASKHRRAAFEASDFLMDALKSQTPFWKKEHGPDGAHWIEPRAEDHADLARWNKKDQMR